MEARIILISWIWTFKRRYNINIIGMKYITSLLKSKSHITIDP